MAIDGALGSLEAVAIFATLTASGEVKAIKAKDKTGAGELTGTFTAQRFGKIEALGGDAQFDLIATGTPSGVGMGMNPPTYLKPGDTVHLGVDGLGEQTQKIIAA